MPVLQVREALHRLAEPPVVGPEVHRGGHALGDRAVVGSRVASRRCVGAPSTEPTRPTIADKHAEAAHDAPESTAREDRGVEYMYQRRALRLLSFALTRDEYRACSSTQGVVVDDDQGRAPREHVNRTDVSGLG
jgi:hypothetical protein